MLANAMRVCCSKALTISTRQQMTSGFACRSRVPSHLTPSAVPVFHWKSSPRITRSSSKWSKSSTSKSAANSKYKNESFGGAKMRTLVRGIQLLAFGAALSCASSHVLVGTPRAPISPDQVKLYLHPPTKYEEIAVLEASSKSSWAVTDQGKTNKVIERLKAEAAKL